VPPSETFIWTVPSDEGMAHVPVSFDQRAVFGRARPPVVVTIGGSSYRSTIAIMAGETFVPLRRSHREAAGLMGGEAVAVTLTLDTAPRAVDVPAEVAEAIAAAGARAAWDALSYSHQREHAEAIEAARRPETRARRITALVATLEQKRRRA
jgi:hypothetical protein